MLGKRNLLTIETRERQREREREKEEEAEEEESKTGQLTPRCCSASGVRHPKDFPRGDTCFHRRDSASLPSASSALGVPAEL